MTRRELIAAAELEVGRPIKNHIVDYCLQQGHIKPTKGPNNWNRYSQKDVKELVRYMSDRARS